MSRRLNSLAGLCALTLGLIVAPITTQAQTGSAAALTPDKVRTAFMRSGYLVDQPLTWDWLSPPLTSFHVYDPSMGRVLLVQVYSYAESAQTVRQLDSVPGYGPTVWFQNVALAEASADGLARLADTELHREMSAADAPVPTAVSLQGPVLDDDLLGLLAGASTIDQQGG